MNDLICIVGLDEPESTILRQRLDMPVVMYPVLPRIFVEDRRLWVETRGSRFAPVSKLIYHGIFEDDLDFITGLALWGGPCLPNARAMMDCRLKLPCLVRALEVTRFGAPRGYVSPRVTFHTETERVAKWGNWHCGENKVRFGDGWISEEAAIIEPYFVGQAVRVALIGDHCWQIKLEGDDWLKSIHHEQAGFMPVDADLLDDVRHIREAFGLEIIANDYIVAEDGSKYLLEVNHIPDVTRFPEMWAAYADYVVEWVYQSE